MSSEPQGRGSTTRRSRGGLGKYLRSRGRGHRGGGRPAEFKERLLLEGEGPDNENEDDEDATEARRAMQAKYARRNLGSNADRYVEPEPDPEEEPEPEVDISGLLDRQRLQDAESIIHEPAPDEDEDVDTSIPALSGGTSRKGKVRLVDWDASMEDMKREKDAAEASRDLKSRFRAKVERDKRTLGSSPRPRKQGDAGLVEAPPLEPDQRNPEGKEVMEEFLDDLLG